MIKITKDSRLMIWGASKEVRSGGAEILNSISKVLGSKCKNILMGYASV